MRCPFYGYYFALDLGPGGKLVEQHGNQCALITIRYSPCRMEMQDKEPDLKECEFNGSAIAIAAAQCEKLHWPKPRP